jgi:hypothetical protein
MNSLISMESVKKMKILKETAILRIDENMVQL